MSGKIKSRSGANAESIVGGVSCDERILRDCHQLYTDPDSGELAVCCNKILRGNRIPLFDNNIRLAGSSLTGVS